MLAVVSLAICASCSPVENQSTATSQAISATGCPTKPSTQSGVRYLGLHVMCYLLGSEPPDQDLLIDETRRSIQSRGRVLSMRTGGKTRVL